MKKLEKWYSKLPNNFNVLEFAKKVLTQEEWKELEEDFISAKSSLSYELNYEFETKSEKLELDSLEYKTLEEESIEQQNALDLVELDYEECYLKYDATFDKITIEFNCSELEDFDDYFYCKFYKSYEEIKDLKGE